MDSYKKEIIKGMVDEENAVDNKGKSEEISNPVENQLKGTDEAKNEGQSKDNDMKKNKEHLEDNASDMDNFLIDLHQACTSSTEEAKYKAEDQASGSETSINNAEVVSLLESEIDNGESIVDLLCNEMFECLINFIEHDPEGLSRNSSSGN